LSPPSLWTITVRVPANAAEPFEAALDGFCQSVSILGIGNGSDGVADVIGIAKSHPERHALDVALNLAAAAAGTPVPVASVAHLEDRDWLAENLAQFPAITVGRFHIYGEHIAEPPPPGLIGLRIDAGTAFGTGEHPSTAGCLLALGELKGRRIRLAYDIGCGSGILAIAMAKLFRCPVIALDIDPRAIAMTRHHAKFNGVAPLVRTAVADGYRSPLLRLSNRADVITSNILARPLRRLAPSLATHLAPGGTAILAGFVARDENAVRARHQAHGLTYSHSIPVNTWRTLVMTAPVAP
jgi:ribosomal protein L11 methyltransferase